VRTLIVLHFAKDGKIREFDKHLRQYARSSRKHALYTLSGYHVNIGSEMIFPDQDSFPVIADPDHPQGQVEKRKNFEAFNKTFNVLSKINVLVPIGELELGIFWPVVYIYISKIRSFSEF
jgi:hypothetical protein